MDRRTHRLHPPSDEPGVVIEPRAAHWARPRSGCLARPSPGNAVVQPDPNPRIATRSKAGHSADVSLKCRLVRRLRRTEMTPAPLHSIDLRKAESSAGGADGARSLVAGTRTSAVLRQRVAVSARRGTVSPALLLWSRSARGSNAVPTPAEPLATLSRPTVIVWSLGLGLPATSGACSCPSAMNRAQLRARASWHVDHPLDRRQSGSGLVPLRVRSIRGGVVDGNHGAGHGADEPGAQGPNEADRSATGSEWHLLGSGLPTALIRALEVQH